MDPKTLFIIFLVLAGAGGTANNFLRIAGFTKTTVVEGGKATCAVGILAYAASAVGWLVFLYILAFHSNALFKAFECGF